MQPTNIEWCDESWNPVTGCTPVSEGCENCYARRMANRLSGRFGYPADDPFRVTFHPDRLDEPVRLKKAKRIFVCSMGDLFHEDVQTEWIDDILAVIAACPQHTFLVLTKRPKNIEAKLYEGTLENPARELGGGDFLPNLWLGVTAENQQRADERIPVLLDPMRTPGFKKFVSVEPCLESIHIPPVFLGPGKVEWVICGAETSRGARHMDPAWALDLLAQCRVAVVPFFIKKMSKRQPIPEAVMVRELPNE